MIIKHQETALYQGAWMDKQGLLDWAKQHDLSVKELDIVYECCETAESAHAPQHNTAVASSALDTLRLALAQLAAQLAAVKSVQDVAAAAQPLMKASAALDNLSTVDSTSSQQGEEAAT